MFLYKVKGTPTETKFFIFDMVDMQLSKQNSLGQLTGRVTVGFRMYVV